MAHMPHTNNQSITYLVNDLKFSLLINRFMLVFSLIFLVWNYMIFFLRGKLIQIYDIYVVCGCWAVKHAMNKKY